MSVTVATGNNTGLPNGTAIATDSVSSVEHQLVKLEFGDAGAATQVSASNPLPVTASSLPLPTGAATAANQPATGGAVDARDYRFLNRPERIPPKIKKAVAKVAKRIIRLGDAKPEPIGLLKQELQQQGIDWSGYYADLLNQQMQQQLEAMLRLKLIAAAMAKPEEPQDDPDEQAIVMLLFEIA